MELKAAQLGTRCPLLRERALLWASLLAVAAGCAAPSTYRQDHPGEHFARTHLEPELLGEAQVASGPKLPSQAPAAAPAPAPAAPPTHLVEPGQTLYRIALLHGVTVEALSLANGITDPRSLSVGQALKLPLAPVAQVAPEVVPSSSATTATAPPAKAPPVPAPSPPPGRRPTLVMPTAPGVLEWPLRGVLYARFGNKGKQRHDGIDLAAPLGTPVTTARAGTVLYAGEQKGYGLIVIVDHGEDLVTLYAHNHDLRVKTGQKVRDRQVLATVGQSGRTSGPQLHFEVRRKGTPVDPLEYLGPPPERRAVGRRGR